MPVSNREHATVVGTKLETPQPADRAAERDALYEREFNRQVDSTEALRDRISDLLGPSGDVQEAVEILRAQRKRVRRFDREDTTGAAVRRAGADEDASCEIVLWRGRSRSQFHAVVPDADGEERWVGESPPFRWPRSRAVDAGGDALAAHTALVRALSRAGWEPEGQGDDWFAGTFRRGQPSPTRGGADR